MFVECACIKPVDIDDVVSAKMPENMDDAALITQFMIHKHPSPHNPPSKYCLKEHPNGTHMLIQVSTTTKANHHKNSNATSTSKSPIPRTCSNTCSNTFTKVKVNHFSVSAQVHLSNQQALTICNIVLMKMANELNGLTR